MTSEQEIETILKGFPSFELSYEIITHNKVHNADIILAIPKGKKCFAWFTNYKCNNACYLLEIDTHKHIIDFKQINVTFSDNLALGTIFYGTLFSKDDVQCFCIEDVYYCKGKYTSHLLYSVKLELLRDIFKNQLNQTIVDKQSVVFGLPFMSTHLHMLHKHIPNLPYSVDKIMYRFYDYKNARKIIVSNYIFKDNKDTKDIKEKYRKTVIFKVTPDIESDIYHLYIHNNGLDKYYDVAFIPNYTTSVMMNKLFRNIRENDNLDIIEESDDEIDFEDNRVDKYVYLDRTYNMVCEYNYKFKKWIPLRLAEKDDKVASFVQKMK